MSLQQSLTLINITNAFHKQGMVSHSYYTKQQLFAALDSMVQGSYDKDVADQLFDQCQANYKEQVLLEDFAQVIIEADKILKRKITQSQEEIVKYQNEQKQCQQQLIQAKQTQRLNALGVDRDSILNINLISAENIKINYDQCIINIQVGNQQYRCNPPTAGDQQNPIFNQNFQFNIETGQEEVIFQVFLSQVLAEGKLELGELHDQSYQEKIIQLQSQNQGYFGGILRIEAQWIYNRVKYCEELERQYEQALNQLSSDLSEFQNDLAIIQSPFFHLPLGGIQSSIRQPQNASIQNSGIYNSNRPDLNSNLGIHSNYGQPPQHQQINIAPPFSDQQDQRPFYNQDNQNQGSPFGFNPQGSQNQNQFQSNRNQQQPPLNTLVKQQQPTGKEKQTDEVNLGFIMFNVFGVLALIACFARPNYFDIQFQIMLYFLCMLIVIHDCFEENFIKIVLGINVGSLVNDIVWLSYYKEWWFANNKFVPQWSDAGNPILKLSLIFCFLSFIIKVRSALILSRQIINCYFLFHYLQQVKAQQKLQINAGQLNFVIGHQQRNIFQQNQPQSQLERPPQFNNY